MTCNGNCKDCNCKDEYIYDESGFIIGRAAGQGGDHGAGSMSNVYDNFGFNGDIRPANSGIQYKYAEDKILADLKKHLDGTYSEHYMTEDQSIECFDAWIALGDSTPTFRNTALKYLWRYGKKNGNNKKDLLKAMHYICMCLYVDHYKDEK